LPARQVARLSSELDLRSDDGTDVIVLVHASPLADVSALSAWLRERGAPPIALALAGSTPRLAARMPRALAGQLAEQRDVVYVERVHELGLFNDRSAGSVQSGMQGTLPMATPIWQHELHGEGQIVGIIDTGVDVDACQFRDASGKLPKINTWSQAGGLGTEVDDSQAKVIAYDFLYSCDQYNGKAGCERPDDAMAWDTAGHGTHCAGSMVGKSMGTNNGMAPAAKLVVQDGGWQTNTCSELPGLGCPAIDLYPFFQQAYAQGVRVQNNSWGDNEEVPPPQNCNYSARSQDVDRFVWDHKDMLLVFATGNSGANNRDFSVASPSTSKNCIAVGSVRTSANSSSDDDISSFSSRGWSADGRIKPDLLAPGCTTSAGNDRNIRGDNCSQDSGCGTSYASPILVGAAALVRQYFTDGFYPSGAKNPADALMPTAALLKAMLINGAVSISGRDNAGQSVSPIPSNEQGWGRIQLDRSLLFSGSARRLFADDHRLTFAAGPSTAVEYRFRGVDASEPFKVTLVWSDAPGMVDSAPRSPRVDDAASFNPPRLVNDLDLRVSGPGGMWLGNVFEAGSSKAGGTADRRNNVEQVLLAKPEAGDFSVSVVPNAIQQAGQDFALVVTGKWQSAMRGDAEPASSAAGAGGAAGMAVAGAGVPADSSGARAQPQAAGSAAGVGAAPPAAGSGARTDAVQTAGAPPEIVPPPMAAAADGCGCRMLDSRTPPRTASALTVLLLLLVFRRVRVRRGRSLLDLAHALTAMYRSTSGRP
jgi:hypothetical protein